MDDQLQSETKGAREKRGLEELLRFEIARELNAAWTAQRALARVSWVKLDDEKRSKGTSLLLGQRQEKSRSSYGAPSDGTYHRTLDDESRNRIRLTSRNANVAKYEKAASKRRSNDSARSETMIHSKRRKQSTESRAHHSQARSHSLPSHRRESMPPPAAVPRGQPYFPQPPPQPQFYGHPPPPNYFVPSYPTANLAQPQYYTYLPVPQPHQPEDYQASGTSSRRPSDPKHPGSTRPPQGYPR